MRLGLAMIVKDAADHLPACLASAAAWVDDIVVADTGSSDATRECARAAGARVVDVPWENDFAAARNHSLAALATDWVLVLDADERLDAGPGWRDQIGTDGCAAYQMTIRNYLHSLDERVWDRPAQANQDTPAAARWPEIAAYPAWVEHQNVRLFRRCPELYFVGRVHESVGPRARACGLPLGLAPGRIHHFGLALAPEAQAAKNRFYRELGRRKLEENPDDAQAHFELGVLAYENFGDNVEALRCCEQSLRRQPDFAPAWFYAGAALLRLGHAAEAEAFLAEAARRGHNSARLCELLGDACYDQGRYAAAAERYGAAAERSSGGDVDSKLGLAELRSGRAASGLRRLRAALEAAPDRRECHDRLVAALVWRQDWESACAAQARRVERFPQDVDGRRRLAFLMERRGESEREAKVAAGGNR